MRSRTAVTALALSIALVTAGALLTACAGAAPQAAPQSAVVRVPGDVPTISGAMERVAPGGLVLVSPGTYPETVTIEKPGVTLRGTDRNDVVIDGGGIRPEGVVVLADDVTVQNFTVHSHTFNGVLVTGLHDDDGARAHGIDGYETLDPQKFPPISGFLIDHVTSYNNGLYGIYAFDSRHGRITNSYASGSADSGFYVGQCTECDILVSGNVAENNAVGFEAANASDSLYVVGNRWSGNRIGMTLLSNYQEAFVPQRSVLVAGNLIADNVSQDSPKQAEGGFGIGIGIQGSTSNTITRNRVSGNPKAGVLLSNAEDLPAIDNVIDGLFESNGVDVANVSLARAAASGNCVSGASSRLPQVFGTDCSGPQASAEIGALPSVVAPPGKSFLRITPPAPQPNLAGDPRAVPQPLPTTIGPVDAARFPVPAADWWPTL